MLPGNRVLGADDPLTTAEIQRRVDDRRRLESLQKVQMRPAYLVDEEGLFPFAC